jgi:phosphoglycolate phosphatase-like HAD superfamily hydrolase
VTPTVLLFDIDGTLVSTGGAGRRAIELAFERAHGRADACAAIRFDGMTDRAIIRLGLQAIGVEDSEAAIDAVIAAYVRALDEQVRSAPDASYRVHDGMREAVALAGSHGVALGLGTGNVREGARLKLERVGLFAPFAFGGFGDDHELRPELIRIGAERGAAALGVPREAARVVIIGDTPKDVQAAIAIGAHSVAVATGAFTVAQLEASGATIAVTTITDALGFLFP